MTHPVGLELVLIAWGLFAGYVYWDLVRVRARARRQLDELMKRIADQPEPERKRQIRAHLEAEYAGYRSYRNRPLWRRWVDSMNRPGNLVFGLLLGIAAVSTLAWLEAETWAQWTQWVMAIVVAVALLALIARVLHRVF